MNRLRVTRLPFLLFLMLAAGFPAIAGGTAEDSVPDSVVATGSAVAVPSASGSGSGSAAGVDVAWTVEGDMLTVTMSAETTGWVAVGFDPTRMMADANIIIAYVADGTLSISDHYGTGNTRHGADTDIGGSDDVVNARGTESNGRTEVTFTIPLDSGDEADRPLQSGGTYKVIVAYGRDGSDNYRDPHAARGSFEMTL